MTEQCGKLEGPDSQYVKLKSSDGHEFIIRREYALSSQTIKSMLSGPGQFTENESNVVNFREIPSHALQRVCHYFQYKVCYTNSSTEIPEFIIIPGNVSRTPYGSKLFGLLKKEVRRLLH